MLLEDTIRTITHTVALVRKYVLDSNGDSVCGHLLTRLLHTAVSALCQDLVREHAPEKLMTG